MGLGQKSKTFDISHGVISVVLSSIKAYGLTKDSEKV